MTNIVSGFSTPSVITSDNSDEPVATEFLTVLPPPKDLLKDYDNTKRFFEQPASIPQAFRDAMSIREQVFGEQGVELDAEFDEDDERSWHWIVYASVAQTSNAATSPTNNGRRVDSPSETVLNDHRRASGTAQRVPVGTVRLVPPPHGPNKYREGDRHGDAEPPASITQDENKDHPIEPYIKLGRLAVLAPFRNLGLSKLLVNTALDYASKHPDFVRPPPSATSLELASHLGKYVEKSVVWEGLALVHAQVQVQPVWAKYGFSEQLLDADGNIEIAEGDHWIEEGIEHVGMWKRLKVENKL